jgi:hypothetical protein
MAVGAEIGAGSVREVDVRSRLAAATGRHCAAMNIIDNNAEKKRPVGRMERDFVIERYLYGSER